MTVILIICLALTIVALLKVAARSGKLMRQRDAAWNALDIANATISNRAAEVARERERSDDWKKLAIDLKAHNRELTQGLDSIHDALVRKLRSEVVDPDEETIDPPSVLEADAAAVAARRPVLVSDRNVRPAVTAPNNDAEDDRN